MLPRGACLSVSTVRWTTTPCSDHLSCVRPKRTCSPVATTVRPGQGETITADSFGTVVDTAAVREPLAEHVPDEAVAPVSASWRTQSLLYTMVGDVIGVCGPFEPLLGEALEHALTVHGVDLAAATRSDLLATYRSLAVFDDVRDGLTRLADAGHEVFVLSNGYPELLEAVVAHAVSTIR